MKRSHSRVNRPVLLVGIALAAVLTVPPILAACAAGSLSSPPERVTLGLPAALEYSAPFFVAQDRQFFAANGLVVTLESYDTGLAATTGLLQDDVEIATAAEYVLVGKAFEGAAIQTLASFDALEFTSVVARVDSGIRTVADLRGKRVGVLKGTNLEFYLGRSLQLHGIGMRELIAVDYRSMADEVAAILGGRVDAVVVTEPYAHAALDGLGDNAVSWSAQSSQPAYQLLLARNEWIEQRPETVKRFLNAVRQAEDFIAQHADQAGAILKGRLNLSEAELQAILARNTFSLTLDMALVMAMEDQARWMVENGLAPAKEIPDVVGYMYVDGLQTVKPVAVSIIR